MAADIDVLSGEEINGAGVVFADKVRDGFVVFPSHGDEEGAFGVFDLEAFDGLGGDVLGAEVAGPQMSGRFARGGNPFVQSAAGGFCLAMFDHGFDDFNVHIRFVYLSGVAIE